MSRVIDVYKHRRPATAESAKVMVLTGDANLARAAAPGELGQAFERSARAAAMREQRTKGARPDILRADQPQPVDAVGFGDGGIPGVHAVSLRGQNGST